MAVVGEGELTILDDELLVNQKFITEFCEALIKNNLPEKIKWSCHARVDSVTSELIKKIKQAGCILVRFGIESGSERCLNFLLLYYSITLLLSSRYTK